MGLVNLVFVSYLEIGSGSELQILRWKPFPNDQL